MYFVAIYKCPIDDEGEHEVVNIVQTEMSEKAAEKLVVETNKKLGHKIEKDESVFAGPGVLVAMCDHMDNIEW